MEELKTKGIVIKAIDYKDSDKLVTIFSPDLGLIRARARGVKKNKAKLTFAAQPFAFVEFVLIQKGDFFTIVNASSIDQFFSITGDFDAFVFMMSCLEIIEKTIKQNEDQTEMFLLLLNAFKAVCYQNASPMIVFVKFMLEAMKILGFAIELDSCANCGDFLKMGDYKFSYDFNGLICSKCANRHDTLDVLAGEYAILNKVNITEMGKLSNLKFLSRNDMISIISLLCKDFRLMTDEEISTIKQYM